MLCLQQCIDLCDLTPDEGRLLAERMSMSEIIAAQAQCPRKRDAAEADTTDEDADIACELLAQVRTAESFDDLRLAALRYRAYSLARAAARG